MKKIKHLIKNLFIYALSCLQIPLIVNKLKGNKNLTILMYHAITDKPLPLSDWSFTDQKLFEKQLKYLKKHFNIVSMSEAISLLKNKKISKPLAVITFDDGFFNNYSLAYPVLTKLNIPATIYVSTKFIDSTATLWFCHINSAIHLTSLDFWDWDDKRFFFRNRAEKIASSHAIQEKLKKLPAPAIGEKVNDIVKELNVDSDMQESVYRMLTSEQIVEMFKSGLIEFGAHTHSHHILSTLSESDQLEEIKESCLKLSEVTSTPCKHFAYPNGQKSDYNQISIKILKDLGIESSVTTTFGINDCNSDLLELKRIGIGSNDTLPIFKAKIHRVIK